MEQVQKKGNKDDQNYVMFSIKRVNKHASPLQPEKHEGELINFCKIMNSIEKVSRGQQTTVLL